MISRWLRYWTQNCSRLFHRCMNEYMSALWAGWHFVMKQTAIKMWMYLKGWMLTGVVNLFKEFKDWKSAIKMRVTYHLIIHRKMTSGFYAVPSIRNWRITGAAIQSRLGFNILPRASDMQTWEARDGTTHLLLSRGPDLPPKPSKLVPYSSVNWLRSWMSTHAQRNIGYHSVSCNTLSHVSKHGRHRSHPFFGVVSIVMCSWNQQIWEDDQN